MKKHKALIVSDIHLGTKDSKAKQFIDFIEQNPTDMLILNGDIVDEWALKRGAKWKKSHTRVITKLLKLSKKTRIIWIRGNHDEFLRDYIDSEFGNIEIKENYKLELYNWVNHDEFIPNHYFIFHGDVIDVFITRYKWIAKLGSIGYDLALWVNRWYNKWRSFRKLPYRSISKDIKKGVKGAVNYINDFEASAIKLAKTNGCNGVICGHIHHAADKYMADGHYLNSGDWVENMTAIALDYNNEFTIIEFKESLSQ